MSEVAPRQLVAYAVLAVLIGVAGAHYARSALRSDGGAASASAVLATATAASRATVADTTARAQAAPVDGGADGGGDGSAAAAIVDVAGAVRHPGVYRLAAGARVDDALRRAGGPTAHADLDPVNLAAPVTDGQQIVVPRHGQAAPATPAAASATAGGASATPAAAVVDLNTATAEQLDTIDGVGPATAQKILEYRAQHGSFKSVEELLQVSGIGPKKLAAMRASVRV